MFAFVITVLSVYGCITMTDAVTATEIKTHITALLANYDTRVRPVNADQSATVAVTLDFYFIGINSFDSSAQSLEITSYLEIEWTDEVMASIWAATGNLIDYVLLPQTSVWLPDIALQNSITSLAGLGSSFQNVKILKAGGVTWKPFEVFTSSCAIDVTYFPFDSTTCELKFIVWSNPISLVKVTKGTKGIDMTLYDESSEWAIDSVTATNFESSVTSGVTFSIKMKRKPLYYLLNILFPVIMLSALNAFVFVLPASSGEKTGLSVTVFLSFAVFLTIISAELPQNSEKISTFAAYLFMMTFISTIIVLITIVELRFFNRDSEQPVPGCLQSITRCVRQIRCACCCRNNGGYIRGIALDEIKARLSGDVTWADAVDSLDFVLFWIFFIITLLVTIMCCVIAATGSLN